MKKGLLITFEGGEAGGKSTQIKKLSDYLTKNNIDFIVSREPGGTMIGQEIRQLLLHSKSDMSPMVEFLLFSASRVEHIEKVVKPALEAGKVVLLDRFYDSSYVYQGLAGNLKFDDIKTITDIAVEGIKPDLTFLLDISYEQGLERKQKDENLKNLDRIESKGKAYHDKVRNGYLKLAKIFDDRIFVVDASKGVDEVFDQIKTKFDEVLKNHISKN